MLIKITVEKVDHDGTGISLFRNYEIEPDDELFFGQLDDLVELVINNGNNF